MAKKGIAEALEDEFLDGETLLENGQETEEVVEPSSGGRGGIESFGIEELKAKVKEENYVLYKLSDETPEDLQEKFYESEDQEEAAYLEYTVQPGDGGGNALAQEFLEGDKNWEDIAIDKDGTSFEDIEDAGDVYPGDKVYFPREDLKEDKLEELLPDTKQQAKIKRYEEGKRSSECPDLDLSGEAESEDLEQVYLYPNEEVYKALKNKFEDEYDEDIIAYFIHKTGKKFVQLGTKDNDLLEEIAEAVEKTYEAVIDIDEDDEELYLGGYKNIE